MAAALRVPAKAQGAEGGARSRLGELVERCWNGRPEERPDFEEIINVLNEISAMRIRSSSRSRKSGTSYEEEKKLL